MRIFGQFLQVIHMPVVGTFNTCVALQNFFGLGVCIFLQILGVA